MNGRHPQKVSWVPLGCLGDAFFAPKCTEMEVENGVACPFECELHSGHFLAVRWFWHYVVRLLLSTCNILFFTFFFRKFYDLYSYFPFIFHTIDSVSFSLWFSLSLSQFTFVTSAFFSIPTCFIFESVVSYHRRHFRETGSSDEEFAVMWTIFSGDREEFSLYSIHSAIEQWTRLNLVCKEDAREIYALSSAPTIFSFEKFHLNGSSIEDFSFESWHLWILSLHDSSWYHEAWDFKFLWFGMEIIRRHFRN